MTEEMTIQYTRGYIDGFKEGKAAFELKTGHWKEVGEEYIQVYMTLMVFHLVVMSAYAPSADLKQYS